MQNTVFEIVATVLIGYLTLTDFLAVKVAEFLGSEVDNGALVIVEEKEDVLFPNLPSVYEKGGAIPDILVKNAAYQKAAVIESSEEATATPKYSIEETLVNIFCTYKTDEYLRATTGTGFFVTDTGVILTNAHVAMFLLLSATPQGGESNCVIRTGDVASATYKANLLYISPAWVQENAAELSKDEPRGTGERDYALLYVTDGIENAAIPAEFPYLPVDTNLLRVRERGTTVTLGGYPAEELLRNKDFIPRRVLSTTTLMDLLTFSSTYADVIYLGGSSIGKQGVSGGPVVSEGGEVIGLISTRGDDSELGEGSLHAITTSYIHRTMLEETGYGFVESVSGNLPYRSKIFYDTLVPFLTSLVEAEL